MVIFGTKIELPKYDFPERTNALTAELFRRKDERVLAIRFLGEKLSNGQSCLECLKKGLAEEDYSQERIEELKQPVFDFYVKRLKKECNNGRPVYDDLMLRVAEELASGTAKSFIRSSRLTGLKTEIPFGVPGILRKAENLILGKLAGDLGPKEYRYYLQEMAIRERLKQVSQDLFFARNFGLNDEQALKFMGLFLEMRLRQTAMPTNLKLLRSNIAGAFLQEGELEVINLKCLRYGYPRGQAFEVINHCGDDMVLTKEGENYPLAGDGKVLESLEHSGEIFRYYLPDTVYRILVMDQDLKDHFLGKSSQQVFAEGCLQKAERNCGLYLENIRKAVASKGLVAEGLRSCLARKKLLDIFDRDREREFGKLYSGVSKMPEGFVESRVNYRYETNKQILASDPGRDYARERTYNQLATLQALGVLRQQTEPFILIEEDKGEENNYIGGHGNTALPVIFVDLRDQLKK